MNDSKRLSRRDWFRLHRPRQSTPANAETHSMGETGNRLQPITPPENHDGLDLSKLPPMREAMLSREQVGELFTDIQQLATDVFLMQRASREARASAGKVATAAETIAAKDSLVSGKITRLQVRYRWMDSAWIDTFESRPEGFRLVRICHTGMS